MTLSKHWLPQQPQAMQQPTMMPCQNQNKDQWDKAARTEAQINKSCGNVVRIHICPSTAHEGCESPNISLTLIYSPLDLVYSFNTTALHCGCPLGGIQTLVISISWPLANKSCVKMVKSVTYAHPQHMKVMKHLKCA